MIRPALLPLLFAAGVGLCAPTPSLAKEKPAAEDAAPDAKADKKKPAKPDTKKQDAAKKPDAKKTAEAKKPDPAGETESAKDKNGKDKTAKDKTAKDKGHKSGNDKAAEDKSAAKTKTPTAIGSYGDWNAMTAHGQGKDKTCYALAEPKDRQPAKLQRDKAYVFISTRPAEGVRNEVAIILGFTAKDGGAASADIDGDNFELVTKGSNAWVKNPAKEKEFVEALKGGSKLTVKAPSAKGNVTTDSYSLKGLSDALGRVQKECP